jgi:hypothetical protein
VRSVRCERQGDDLCSFVNVSAFRSVNVGVI